MSVEAGERAVPRRWDLLGAAMALLLPLAAYLRTLAPAEVGGDAGEFQFVPAVLGIPHYTGYPLYTLLGWLVIHLDPVGTAALKMNALSAIAGALACLGVYLTVRVAGGGVVAGLVGAATLASAPLEWRWATIAGVRAAAAAFTALVFLLAFRWGAAARVAGSLLTNKGTPAIMRSRWLWLCFGLGLALAHHRSSAFFGPALAVYVALIAPPFLRRWRLLALGIAVGALPLLLYLYLPLRSAVGAPYDQFHPTTWANFAELVFAPQLSRALLSIPPAEYPTRALLLGQALRDQLGPLTWFAALGLAVTLRYRPAEALAAAIYGALVCAQVIDWNIPGGLNVVYLIPVLVVCALLAGAGVEGAARLARSRLRLPVGHFAVTTVIVIAALAVALQGRATDAAQRADAAAPLDAYHQDLTAGWRGHRLAAAALPYLAPNAVIAADWEQATIFWYQKLVARTIPGATIDFGGGSLADLSPEALARQYPNRPLYLARSVPWAAGHHPSAAGPLIALSATPRLAPPPGITLLSARLEGGMELVGYQVFDVRGNRVAAPSAASPVLPVLLVWRTATRQTHDLSVSVRLLNSGGAPVRSVDNSSPVYGLAPTTSWAAGEVVADYYELPLTGLASGSYTLQALLYYQPTPGAFKNLQTLGANGAPAGTGVTVLTVRR